MHILVTGAGGFLGRQLVQQLAEHHQVLAMVRAFSPDLPTHANITWLKADLSRGLDETVLPDALDGIVHLAQSSNYRDFPIGAADVFAVNIALVQQLCDYGLRAGISRMVLASTGTVYEPFETPMLEDVPVSPTGYYPVSKLAAEMIATTYREHFSVANLRVFFVYGPNQSGMLIARLIERVRAGQSVTLPDDGQGMMFVPTFVEDTASVFVTAVNDGWNQVVNVASPHAISMRGLLDTISQATDEPLIIASSGPAPAVSIVPDLSRMASLVDLDRFHTVEDGMARTVAV